MPHLPYLSPSPEFISRSISDCVCVKLQLVDIWDSPQTPVVCMCKCGTQCLGLGVCETLFYDHETPCLCDHGYEHECISEDALVHSFVILLVC